MASCIVSLYASILHSSLVMFSLFSHAGLAACGEFFRVALSAALVISETDITSSATFPFRMAYLIRQRVFHVSRAFVSTFPFGWRVIVLDLSSGRYIPGVGYLS